MVAEVPDEPSGATTSYPLRRTCPDKGNVYRKILRGGMRRIGFIGIESRVSDRVIGLNCLVSRVYENS